MSFDNVDVFVTLAELHEANDGHSPSSSMLCSNCMGIKLAVSAAEKALACR